MVQVSFSARSRSLALVVLLLIGLTPLAIRSSQASATPSERTEVPELRNSHTKVFRERDGQLTAEISAAPVHLKNSQGKWEDIETDLVASERSGFKWKTKKTAAGIEVSKSPRKKDLIVLGNAAGKVGFGLSGADEAVTGQVSGPTVTYSDVFPSVDLRYEALSDGVKEELILKERSEEHLSFDFPLTLKHFSAVQDETNGPISLVDKHGRTKYTIPPAWMEESGGERGRSQDVGMTLVQSPDGPLVRVTPDHAWLQDPDRMYPVVVDPTTVSLITNWDTHVDSEFPGTSYYGRQQLDVGPRPGGVYRTETLVKFSNLSSSPGPLRMRPYRCGTTLRGLAPTRMSALPAFSRSGTETMSTGITGPP